MYIIKNLKKKVINLNNALFIILILFIFKFNNKLYLYINYKSRNKLIKKVNILFI